MATLDVVDGGRLRMVTAPRAGGGGNVNRVRSDRLLDRFSGMPVFNGVPCRIEKVAEEQHR